MIEYRSVNGHGERKLQHELTERASRGRIPYLDLWQALYTINEGGFEGIPGSAGWNWVRENPGLFERAVGNVSHFLIESMAFVELDPLRHWLFEPLLCHAEFLLMLGDEERDMLFEAMFVHAGARNNGWVSAAKKAGVSREAMARALIRRLEAVEYERGMMNDVDEFLDYGDGYLNSLNKTSWSVLTDDELVQAVRICIGKSPDHVLPIRKKLECRLPRELVNRLMAEAAAELTLLGGALDEIDRLPLEAKAALAGRLKPLDSYGPESATATFLIKLALELGKDGQDFWRDVASPVLAEIDPSVIYRAYRRLNRPAPWLEQWLRQDLERAGYVFGTVKEGSYFDRRRQKECRQMRVRINGSTYVADRSEHRYFPKVGDQVLFRPASGHQLTPQVVAVNFIPVLKEAN